MADRPGSHDFVYVHTDIPAGMTIREWRAQRAASRPAADRRSRLAGSWVRGSVVRMWRAAAPPSPGAPA
jgi:hypothetical protein